MKKLLSIFFSFLFAFHAHAGFVLERIDGTIWDKVERLRVPNNQITKLGDKRYRLETGNENVLVNPNFQASQVAQGWTYNPANFDLVKLDDTYAYTGTHSLQLDLKQGNFTDLELISQTYAAGYKLGGSDLEASIRIAKAVLDPAVTLKWCASVDNVIVNCVTVPSLPANTSFQKYAVAFASKPAFATTYKVGLYATYNVAAGAVGVLALADASLKPYSGKGLAPLNYSPTPYIPTVTHTSGGATNYTIEVSHSRIFDTLKVRGKITFSNTSAAFSGMYISLPNGLNPISSITAAGGSTLGQFRLSGSAGASGMITWSQALNAMVLLPYSVEVHTGTAPVLAGQALSNTFPTPAVAGIIYFFNADIPIEQWSQSTATVAPETGANLLGTHFYTREPQCPVNSVSDNATITRAQYPALFAKWQIAAGTDTLALANAGLVIRSTGTQTFGGKTYTATLNQKRNDAFESHTHGIDINTSASGVQRAGAATGTVVNTYQSAAAGSGSETHGPDIAHTGCYWAVANPFLPISGLVTSNSQSNERIERARFSCQTSSIVNNQSTGFIASIGNAVDAGTYRTCTVVFNTPFASQPECPASTVLGTGTLPSGYVVALMNITTSGFTLVGPDSDFFASVVCMGPR